MSVAARDTELPADLEDAVTIGLQFKNFCYRSRPNPTPAEMGSIRPALNLRMTPLNPFGVGRVPT
jgi:hypothetical protein